ncbi:hypothetical protein [Clostridium sp. JN-9]|uniref:hypothetical protein n=1 Tax=Clostridium sp. JN-9 TaxID=2507159 RepID=UPI000FFE1615|nr:hypothetical protein [Clostridium sp. JN-9]QAT39792.1 hypothetical protein EQM05_05735 [Clostridium sp. JN-9]
MKLKFNMIVLVSCLILLLSGCTKPNVKQIVKPFEDITIDTTKRIEFSNFTIRSNQNESGRSKIITNTQDMQDIAIYLKTISCIESNQKEKDPDFTISFINNTEKAKSYIYSIGVSKNQIYVYKYKGNETAKFVYKYTDSKVTEELRKLYNSLNYREVLLIKK